MIDEARKEVIILTDHFSKYALFEVEGSGTRTAFAKPLDANRLAQLRLEKARRILESYESGAVPPDSEDRVAEVLDALDGSFNGKLVFGASAYNTLKSQGGTVNTSWIKSLGIQCTILCLIGSSISVAQAVYKNKGVFNEDTMKAVTNLAISFGVNFATAPIQYAYLAASSVLLCYNKYAAYEQAETTKTFEILLDNYLTHVLGKRSARDWRLLFDPFYDKYFTVGSGATPADNYAVFEEKVRHVVDGYAYAFSQAYETGELERIYGDIGCLHSVGVFHNSTDNLVGAIRLPADMSPGVWQRLHGVNLVSVEHRLYWSELEDAGGGPQEG